MTTALLPSDKVCSICQGTQNGRLIELHRVENIAHIFHENCIRPWVERQRTCPIDLKQLTDEEVSRVIPPHPFDEKHRTVIALVEQSLNRLLNGLPPHIVQVNQADTLSYFKNFIHLIERSYPANRISPQAATVAALEVNEGIDLMIGMGAIQRVLTIREEPGKLDDFIQSIILTRVIKKDDQGSLQCFLTNWPISQWVKNNKLVEAIGLEHVAMAECFFAQGARIEGDVFRDSLETAIAKNNRELVLLLQRYAPSDAT